MKAQALAEKQKRHPLRLKGKARQAFNVAAAILAFTTLSHADQPRPDSANGEPFPTETVDTVQPFNPSPIVYTPPPLPPAPSIAKILGSDEEKERNIFFKQNRQSLREFRALRGDSETTGGISRAEQRLIAEITEGARADAKTYKMPLAVVATLHFAARQTGVDSAEYMQRLTETGGIVTGADRSGLSRTNLFKFNVPTFLYLMKQHGGNHGFGFFTDQIRVTMTPEGAAQVSVDDPAVLRHIISFRANPRVSALIGAEYMQNSAEMPQAVHFHRAVQQSTPEMREQQNHMLVLGFDLGIRGADGIVGPLTRAGLHEFGMMSRPLYEPGQTTASLLRQATEQAIADSERYTNQWRTVTPADAFAIRHAAKVVGVDYGYMMELVSAESGFVSDIEATTSSATGLFQFIDSTWLLMVKGHGAKYGLADLADRIDIAEDRNGYPVASVENPFVQKYILSLRTNPRLSAMMGAEFVKENYDNLSAALPNRDINRTDQYLAHFLGSGNAVTFISRMNRNGGHSAATVFPAAAASNRNIFYKRGGGARSFNEVYGLFSGKFDTNTFDDPAPQENIPLPPPRPPRP
ncbi:MAG: hypothetical protein Q8K65_00025 [Alphaproteobacteria bacterium]|nr:hypothetical protein [Alphaproteobacteria bacterium]